jgi:hypothetical protein
MRSIVAVIFGLLIFQSFAQTNDDFTITVKQGDEVLDITKGLKNYEPIRVSWVNKTKEKLKAIEVHFGNGQLPFTSKTHKIAKGQQLIVIDVPQFQALDQRDLDSPRKRESEFSRIVIVCVLENTKYFSFAIPFKLRE